MCSKYIVKSDFSKFSQHHLKRLDDLCSTFICSSSSCCQNKEDELVLRGPCSYLMCDDRKLQVPLGLSS